MKPWGSTPQIDLAVQDSRCPTDTVRDGLCSLQQLSARGDRLRRLWRCRSRSCGIKEP